MNTVQTTFKPAAAATVVSAGAYTSLPASSTALVPVVPQRHYQRRGRRFRHGACAAALRAVTAGRAYLRGDFPSLVAATDAHGSCPVYVQAAIVVLQGGDSTLLGDVLAGNVLLFEAAETEKNVARLQVAYHQASADERTKFARRIGVGALWDACISPAL